jgi:hypothetical protein
MEYKTSTTAANVFAKLGISPYICFKEGWMDILTQVANGRGIAFCPENTFRQLNVKHIAGIPLPYPEMDITVMGRWKNSSKNENIRQFIKIVNTYSDEPQTVGCPEYPPRKILDFVADFSGGGGGGYFKERTADAGCGNSFKACVAPPAIVKTKTRCL